MDFNQYVHEMASTSEANVYAFAKRMYEAMNDEDLSELHPEDQECYIEFAKAALVVIQQHILDFEG
jgi:hypothetical protein